MKGSSVFTCVTSSGVCFLSAARLYLKPMRYNCESGKFKYLDTESLKPEDWSSETFSEAESLYSGKDQKLRSWGSDEFWIVDR